MRWTRRWPLVVGGIPWVLEIWRWIKRALEWGEHTEYVAHHLNDLQRVWAVIAEPSGWVNVLLLVAGGTLIWWDLKRVQKRSTSNSQLPAATSAVAMPALLRIPTRLRIQFSGGPALPREIDQQNVFRWYALAQLRVEVGPNRPRAERITSWAVTVIFDQPTEVRNVRIDGGPQLPRHEIKDASARHAIIAFDGDIPPGVLEISAEF